MKAMTGMKINEFKILLEVFGQVLKEHFASKPRKRKVGGGRKGALSDSQSKLFYILFYLKVYPTYDLGSFIFDVDRSRCFQWTVFFMPFLEKALGRCVTLPKRQISSMEEFLGLCPEAKDLFIDASERRVQRSKRSKLLRKRYSGKKKTHTRKNTIIATEKRKILFLSPTKEGRLHDFKQLKKTGVLDHLPPDKTLWLDKAYSGITSALKRDQQIMMPHKKPKGKCLTPEQKQENKIISGIRIVAEHAINGIKRFGSMSSVYRNRKGQDDNMIYLCASLWNFHLQYADC